MHPSVQPPAITKSVVLLLCLWQSDLQTNASFQLYAWQHKEFYLGQLTETGKDTLQKLWEGRSELEMNQTVSNQWFIGLRHWMGHFQNKEGTNAGGVLLPLCFIFYFLHLNKLLHMETWKVTKATDWGGHKCTENMSCVAKRERDFRLRGTDAAHWNQWEESNIFTSVYVQI